jgi:hypothetical protein
VGYNNTLICIQKITFKKERNMRKMKIITEGLVITPLLKIDNRVFCAVRTDHLNLQKEKEEILF